MLSFRSTGRSVRYCIKREFLASRDKGRLFRGNGKSWEDRDEDQNETGSTEMENDSVNRSSEAEEAF